MTEQTEQFEQWAKLELMGHRVLFGKISEQEIAGKRFVRIDIPSEHAGGDTITQFYSPDAVYAVSPITEELARSAAKKAYGSAPISEYDLVRNEPEPKQIEVAAEHPDSWLNDENPF